MKRLKAYGKISSKMDEDDTLFESPLPFAPPDSFFLHATAANGKTLYRKRFDKARR